MKAFSLQKKNLGKLEEALSFLSSAKKPASLRCRKARAFRACQKAKLSEQRKEEGTWRKVSPLMKGLSPLVAVVLLIAMVVLVSGIIFGWIQGFSLLRTEEISNRSEELTGCSGSAINIDDVYLDFVANKSRVTVRNTGQLTERIVSAQLLNTNGQNATLLGNQTVTLSRGEIKIVEFALNGTVSNCANFSQVKVSTLCASNIYRRTPTNCG